MAQLAWLNAWLCGQMFQREGSRPHRGCGDTIGRLSIRPNSGTLMPGASGQVLSYTTNPHSSLLKHYRQYIHPISCSTDLKYVSMCVCVCVYIRLWETEREWERERERETFHVELSWCRLGVAASMAHMSAGAGGPRRHWQIQMQDQSTGRRMQLARIKCFRMAIKLTAGLEDMARLILVHKVHCICISERRTQSGGLMTQIMVNYKIDSLNNNTCLTAADGKCFFFSISICSRVLISSAGASWWSFNNFHEEQKAFN